MLGVVDEEREGSLFLCSFFSRRVKRSLLSTICYREPNIVSSRARGRIEESSGKVTEWGPHSVESAYVTSGRAPVANSGKARAKGETEDPVEAGKGKKAKKRAAKEQAEKEERERAAAAQKEGTAESPLRKRRHAKPRFEKLPKKRPNERWLRWKLFGDRVEAPPRSLR